ncbi:acetyl-CoA hydrolase/transferase family protein [Paludibacter sp. 221]|uniref:acetyl-CoA hydrolase/transferase family protein n=1 Tax=Paludibacter sp. 221 TaxID=2302939 RepID=UPI0013D5CC62|nr:acetyl-CoA hydrolase/transferase family protein [Paludibacter sp. 221]NDV45789.1 acetyl-CoA hydrolase/transferase family protein [Paludibacter sp. 221]
MRQTYKFVTADEAAAYINNGDMVGFSGFTPAGSPKAVPTALAKRAEALHAEGKEFKIGMYTGASTGDSLDGALARANAILFRTPYQSNKDLRSALNCNDAHYFDMHLSTLPQELRYGFMPKPKFAVLEVCDFNADGELVLTTAVGISPTVANLADYIILEWNHKHPKELRGFHDIYEPQDPPYRKEIPLYKPSDRIGSPVIKVDPKKILCVVETELPDEVGGFTPVDEVTAKIGANVALFLANELKAGRIPKEFLPIQSGVGNIANAVLGSLGANPDIPPFEMYTEVIQDAVIDLMYDGNVKFASGCSLTVSNAVLEKMYSNLDFFRDKLVLRPQEISNNPELVRRMGLITINTALEADIFGNVNSTHVLGQKMMNGIGGSGDFTRNAYISIFTTPSTAKGGKISSIVPMVSHLDHSEHSVKVIITEHGIADLRGKSPIQRANEIIENCVAPEYQEVLRDYLKTSGKCHTNQNLSAAFAMHNQFKNTGSMEGINWEDYK